MRSFLAPLALLASVVTGYAQFTDATLPPLSTTDGAVIDLQTQNPQWAASALSNYSSTSGFVTPSAGGTDSWGHQWTTNAPDLLALNATGGTVREIFLGPGDASWLPAVGYTYLTSPSSIGNSYTLDFSSGVYAPSTFAFGDYSDVNMLPGQVSAFDLWFGTTSGVYTAFNPANSQTSSAATAQVLWTNSPFLVSTYLPGLDQYGDVATWIGSVVETPVNGTPHEFRFGLQEYFVSGEPLNPTPVPEASTYGIFGAAALIGLALRRKYRR